jgi:uncharacterized protein YukE
MHQSLMLSIFFAMNRRLKEYIGIAIAVVLVIVGVRFTQDLEDWSKLATYQPSVEVARLATATTMTDKARKLFYVNQPTIETQKSDLNRCQRTEHTVVLGCYVTNKGIFLQSVTDPRLQGVMEVTAAHEMLHVAFGRLSIYEQNQLGNKLKAALTEINNPRIIKMIETYRAQDPKSVENELHSILGTEIQTLSPELEEHYRQYFTSRSTVVALSEKYEGVFTALRDKTKSLNLQLETRKSALERLTAQVKQEADIVESERSELQTAIVANPQGDYSVRVSAFNSRVQGYNQLVGQLREQTEAYNQMVTEHNSLTLEQKSLIESLENKSVQQVTR